MRKLRNLNRGILLFIILIIAFGGYIVYDNIRFQKEKPAIEKLITEYYGHVGEMNLLPEQYRKTGEKVPNEVIAKKLSENNALMSRYWIQDYNRRGQSQTEVQAEIKRLFEKQQVGDNKIQSAKCGVKKVSEIKKTSPNGASATVEFFMTLELPQNAEFYSGGLWLSQANDGYGMSDDKAPLGTFQSTMSIGVEMTRAHGEWKISAADSGYSSTNTTFTVQSDPGTLAADK